MDEFSGIAFCPTCVSNVDVRGEGEQTLECVSCGQVWTMEVSQERFAEFNIH